MVKKPHQLSDAVETIETRNQRVEIDKAWETSWTRRLCIASATYLIVAFYLPFLGVEHNFLHACVPAMGYLFSTMTLQSVRRFWMKQKA